MTKKDILQHIESGAAAPAPAETPRPRRRPSRRQLHPKAAPAPAPAAAAAGAGETLEPMSAMRKGIAEHMRRSLDTSAHVTSAIEVDMTKIAALRQKLKREWADAYGVNPTYLAFVARAVVDTLKDYPWINGEIRGDSIVTRNYVNLGFAVELADGKGLIVPVVRNAEGLNLLGMARAIADVAERARDKQLLPDDVQGGTFTITNPGGYGTFHGTPVISQPQAAILGTYAVVKRPWVVAGRARPGRDRDPLDHEPHPHLRPSARRRRARRPLPARSARAPRELGRDLRLAEPAILLNLGSHALPRGMGPPARARRRGLAGRDPRHRRLLEHPPVITLGRRTDGDELHVPTDAEVEVVETDRGGKSTFHGPGQLVCYPILDLNRHGRDVKRYCRDLEEAVIRHARGLRARSDADRGAHRRLAPRARRGRSRSIGVHISRWMTTHGYALNVDLDPAPFTALDHRLRPRGRGLHDDGARARTGRSPSTRCARSPPPRSRTCSSSILEELPAR